MEDYCFYHEKSVLANICKYMVIANKRICIFGPKKAVEDENKVAFIPFSPSLLSNELRNLLNFRPLQSHGVDWI